MSFLRRRARPLAAASLVLATAAAISVSSASTRAHRPRRSGSPIRISATRDDPAHRACPLRRRQRPRSVRRARPSPGPLRGLSRLGWPTSAGRHTHERPHRATVLGRRSLIANRVALPEDYHVIDFLVLTLHSSTTLAASTASAACSLHAPREGTSTLGELSGWYLWDPSNKRFTSAPIHWSSTVAPRAVGSNLRDKGPGLPPSCRNPGRRVSRQARSLRRVRQDEQRDGWAGLWNASTALKAAAPSTICRTC